MKKKVLILLLVFIFVVFENARIVQSETIKITLFVGRVSAYVNGKEVPLDVPIIIDKTCNRTLVPLRFISEAFGANVKWFPESKKIKITLSDKTITLQIGKKTAYINGSKIEMDCTPKILFSRTIVPIRFISEAFGADVKWFPKTKKIEITFEKSENKTEKTIKANPDAVNLIKKTVKVQNGETGKITFFIVKIKTNDRTIKILPFVSKFGPKTRESYSSFIERVKPIVAINGGTFDLETNELTGDVVKNGVPQFIRYDGWEYTETMGIDKNGVPFFADGKAKYILVANGKEIPILSVNGLPAHPYMPKVKIYTNWYKEKITAKNGEEIAIVKNGTVEKITDSLYPQTLSDSEWAALVKMHVKANDKISIKILINGKDYSGSSFVRCGPLLVKNGKAYLDYIKYANLNRTMKKGARSLIGIGKDGNFYFIYTPDPVRVNYGTLSVALEKCNLFKYVISLDGGGSVLLYYKGRYIARPGRKIIDIIAVPSETSP